ncbi:MAG: NAD(P)-dependent oxidoreductase [Chitinophagaceae bacterium]|nr:NAD(P)-dependent oxidoreductase [Chitinophagaceae bacterium]
MPFKNKTIFITGASRGIGKAIALKLAADGANIVIAAKSVTEDPRLGGTIYSAAEEVEAAGGKALAIQLDIRDEAASKAALEQAAAHFGGIDALINNASAINLLPTEKTEPRRYDLMHDINVRGTFFLCQAAIPFLKKSSNAHIINLSPPINMQPKWFAGHLAYTISKYNMSMIAYGLAAELKPFRIAANALWPKTTIATAAVNNLLGGEMLMKLSRTPAIIADAVHYILQQPAAQYTGQFLLDEEVLAQAGIADLDAYAYVPGNKQFYPDLFIGE